MLVTLEVSQSSGWLNLLAYMNMLSIVSTAEVLVNGRGWLNLASVPSGLAPNGLALFWLLWMLL